MARYFCFLRGMNVGGHRVTMSELGRLFEKLGLENVETFIASGNVIFDSAARDTARLEQRIADHLKRELNYEVATFIRSRAELAAITAFQPFAASELEAPGHSLLVLFLPQPLSAEAQRDVAGLRSDVDEYRAHGREIYWLCRTRITETKISGAQLAKAVRRAPTTARNVNTLQRLVLKYEAGKG